MESRADAEVSPAAAIDEVVHHARGAVAADFFPVILEVMRIPGHGDFKVVAREEAIERSKTFRGFGDIMAFRGRGKIPATGEARMADDGHGELASAAAERTLNPRPLSLIDCA